MIDRAAQAAMNPQLNRGGMPPGPMPQGQQQIVIPLEGICRMVEQKILTTKQAFELAFLGKSPEKYEGE